MTITFIPCTTSSIENLATRIAMFGLFKTKPPLVPIEKAWTEYRMNWLASHFGTHRLLETPTLTPDYSGIPSVTNFDEADRLLDFLRTWMKIDAQNVRLQIHSDVVSPDMVSEPDNMDRATLVKIREDDFAHRDTLIAALARGLAHESIAEHGLTDQLVNDNNWTVELLPAFLGLGAFAANATVGESNYSDGVYSSWSMSRRGNLPSRMFGYAMALRAFARGDDLFTWSERLRQDAKVAFENGLKYLEKTGDTTFDRDSLDQPRELLKNEVLFDDLENGTPSRKISALWELEDRVQGAKSKPTADMGQHVVECVNHRDADVRSCAIGLLPVFMRSQEAVQEVCDAFDDPKEDVRMAAAASASQLAGIDDSPLIEVLTRALKDESRFVVFNAAESLSKFGDSAEPAIDTLIKRLHRSFVDCRDEDGLRIASTLLNILPNAATARELFDDAEAEFRDYGRGIIDQLTSTPE